MHKNLSAFSKHQRTLRKMIRKSTALRELAERTGLPALVWQCNLIQYVSLWSHDYSGLVEEMLRASSRWKKKLYARHLAITIFEGTSDFAVLLGKPLRDHLVGFGLATRLEAERKTLHKEIVQFARSHGPFLKRIRNSVIGHRDHNAKTQIELIDSMKPAIMYRLCLALIRWSKKFYQTLLIPILQELDGRLARVSK